MAEQQVKSRQRVADHGEVFTAEREVKAMCDLVKQETERIESYYAMRECSEYFYFIFINFLILLYFTHIFDTFSFYTIYQIVDKQLSPPS